MQSVLPKIYLFIEDFIPSELNLLNKNVSIIFRNYEKKISNSGILALKNYCKSKKRDLYLANDIKRSLKYKLNGVYIPSFNWKLNFNTFSLPKNFIFLGSAHNQHEVNIKETQGCSIIFLAPTFKVKKKKNYLGVTKFNLLTLGLRIIYEQRYCSWYSMG